MVGSRCIIVASGPSARGFEPPADVLVIAVNGAIDWLSRADWFFTLDPSTANLQRLATSRHGVRYAVAFPAIRGLPGHVLRFERHAERGIEPSATGSPEWWFWRWSAVSGLSTDPNRINTGNSAYGALGLAFHLGCKQVALVGVDATADERIEGGHPNNLSHLPLLFASAREQIDVTSCGLMGGIPHMELLEWLEKTSPSLSR
ncbi:MULTISPECIES: hypothetical protein [unclassified Pseudomonas]|uniref:hypothetical protein n=1 Tax=unclassified Pseudomonas TaxID=196821 RepID=UPI00128B9862|nr:MULTISPECIES: hypothetical protein [unclassified Pseudomonas]MPQ68329.1 norphogenetic protein [Pseudomonas sp. MWU12-2323]